MAGSAAFAGHKPGLAQTGLEKVKAAARLAAAYVTQSNEVWPAALLWRGCADRDQRLIGRASFWAAGRSAFAEELRGVARGPAIGRHQDFVIFALDRAARGAIGFDHPNAAGGSHRTLRAGRTLRARGACRTGRTCGACSTDIALRPCRTGVALRSLATRRQSASCRQQYGRQCQMPCTHFQVLPKMS